MSKLQNTKRYRPGFTLVELAIVLTIIGLLIGGVLKGQQLMQNARVTKTASQIQNYDAVTHQFRDMYGALPGDLVSPELKLPHCELPPIGDCANPVFVTHGDGILNCISWGQKNNTDCVQFFLQLVAADMITEVAQQNAAPQVWGTVYPAAKIGGGFQPSWSGGVAADFPPTTNTTSIPAGLWLNMTRSQLDGAGAPAVAPFLNPFLTPTEAFSIDSKLDDSQPDSGDVRSYDDGVAGSCKTVAAPAEYATTQGGEPCGLLIHIQG